MRKIFLMFLISAISISCRKDSGQDPDVNPSVNTTVNFYTLGYGGGILSLYKNGIAEKGFPHPFQYVLFMKYFNNDFYYYGYSFGVPSVGYVFKNAVLNYKGNTSVDAIAYQNGSLYQLTTNLNSSANNYDQKIYKDGAIFYDLQDIDGGATLFRFGDIYFNNNDLYIFSRKNMTSTKQNVLGYQVNNSFQPVVTKKYENIFWGGELSIDTSNNDKYLIASYSQKTNNPYFQDEVYKNGVKLNIFNTTSNNYSFQKMLAYNSKIYIAGMDAGKPALWINGIRYYLSNEIADSYFYNLKIFENKIYLTSNKIVNGGADSYASIIEFDPATLKVSEKYGFPTNIIIHDLVILRE